MSNRYEFIGGVEWEIERIKNQDRPMTLQGLFYSCVRNVKGLIQENLWDYDVEPARTDLQAIVDLIRTEWLPQVEQADKALIESVKALMQSQAFIQDMKASLQ